MRVLEAGHPYSYGELGVHHEHCGLLVRRDVHKLAHPNRGCSWGLKPPVSRRLLAM